MTPFEGARNDPEHFDDFPALKRMWVDSLVDGDTARPRESRGQVTGDELVDVLHAASGPEEFVQGFRALVEGRAPAPERRRWWHRLRLPGWRPRP